ncbi:MAG: hypothetical protein N2038_14940 [Geminicoccaceae bacterium]|nr:hypothetical protein [Geminicoccaceae bacterium]MCS7268489.1 hypothetical protein [Geminicoccaceae bacterium]MCX7631522.1 hypothetical protein [Geminicoccaceae bacterium]MDW8124379.1 hypothetical protein [Geminicoccaceae bacterium]MDW8340849.1 hypothetical protein [Geminicoccaceae bacterium]
MTDKIASLLGLLLFAAYIGLIVFKIMAWPLILIGATVVAMAAWHALEEEWLGRG